MMRVPSVAAINGDPHGLSTTEQLLGTSRRRAMARFKALVRALLGVLAEDAVRAKERSCSE